MPNRSRNRTISTLSAALLSLAVLAVPAPAQAASTPTFTGVTMARVTRTQAQLDARIDPGSSTVTSCRFEWGQTIAYDHSAQCLSNTISETLFAGTGGAGLLPAGAILNGLSPDTTYHFRLVVANGEGAATGPDQAFTTDTANPAPGVGVDGRRTLEWVSSAVKNGSPLLASYLADNGDRALWLSGEAGPESTAPGVGWFLSDRTPTGWISHTVPWHLGGLGTLPFDGISFPVYVAPDLSSFMTFVQSQVPAPNRYRLLGMTADGEQALLHTYPQLTVPDATGEYSQHQSTFSPSAAGDGLRHVFVFIGEPDPSLDPEQAPETVNLYDVGGGRATLVSRLPGPGGGSVPLCGTYDWEHSQADTSGDPHGWASTDGSHFFFESRGNNCSSPYQLYLRDVENQTTRLVSGPVAAGPEGRSDFLKAAPDASWVIYASESRLSAADTNSSMDIYRWDAATETNTCLTCVVPEADASAAGGGVSADGSHVYFHSPLALTPDVPPGFKENLYVVSGGEVRYVAPGSTESLQTTSDGSVAAWRTGGSGFVPDGNVQQWVRYNDRDRSLVCMSCGLGVAGTPNEAPAIGLGNSTINHVGRSIADDGETFVFATSDPLVPSDIDASRDVYEWHAGKVALISDGVTPRQSAQAGGLGANGRDLLFAESGEEIPGVTDTSSQLYDARIGGGFPHQPPPAQCQGENCLGAATVPPAEQSPATPLFSGPGNPAPIHKKHRHKKKRHRRAVHRNRRAGR